MFRSDTTVHDDETESRRARAFLGGRFVLDALLHPHGARPNAYGGVDDFHYKFRATKNIHNVDLFGNIFQPSVTFFAKHFRFVGIHRNDAIAGGLKILRDSKARTVGFRREAYNRDGFRRGQQFGNRGLGFLLPSSKSFRRPA